MLIRGQVLLLTTLILGALISSAYLFIGFLSVKKLKQANNIIDSEQALFVLRSGIEEEIYRITKSAAPAIFTCPFSGVNPNVGFRTVSCANGDAGDRYFELDIKSIGQSYRAVRADKNTSQTISRATQAAAGVPLCSSNPPETKCPSNLRDIY